MREVIELLSDPIEPSQLPGWPQLEGDIIELSDEVESEIIKKNTTCGESLPNILSCESSRVKPLRCLSSENLLDLGNWVSSDEESFNVSLRYTPLKISSTKPEHSVLQPQDPLVQLLPSSPVAERILELEPHSNPEILRQTIHQENRSLESTYELIGSSNELFKVTASLNALGSVLTTLDIVNKKRSIRAMSTISDPIESSSPMKSPPPRKRVKALNSREKATNDHSKAWKAANKAIRRKQDILGEMVIEIALCLEKKIETEYFRSIFVQPTVRSSYLELPLISWKRRVTAKYNKQDDTFEPCELTELSERVFILFYEAEELMIKLKSGVVSSDIERVKSRAKLQGVENDAFLLLMVPSFSEYLRKLQAVENRQYRAKTLEHLNPSQVGGSLKLRETNVMSASEALMLLIESEVNLSINIFTPRSIEEAIDWLHSFTYTIGSSIYDKFERNPEFASIGAVRLGSTPKGMFLEMVKKFNLMTDPKAENLYQYYASPLSLYKRFLESDDLGTVQGKSIVPPSVNKLMKKVFTCEDPNAVITD
ncbi:hypothetical protein METBIDRAFT_13860 [Metschnikowia bicuspidata var. bicuspidata NRRL YB-4993]|uniref:ERCC4 domain-containing protein n=1 Tax=Metschnikowia bicuspidata var. bicuspidata NRRL YB-4993 TaxID=869754 RepID=A0A1A0H5C1_9ASCO|nr:hypothetical protein METBIDRAFT_13860 [Metschnikowia bicuspidata var. bicuspidata NRRL YB-4993]OBA19118.1 hypothetical protein METBIDRAFT_13860 [Metschnikowia bicuspidata var. bicuspidata NRRL YB-4993]